MKKIGNLIEIQETAESEPLKIPKLARIEFHKKPSNICQDKPSANSEIKTPEIIEQVIKISTTTINRKNEGYNIENEVFEELADEFIKLSKKLGHFPDTSDLQALNRHDLRYKIKKLGGTKRAIPNIKYLIKERGQFKDEVSIDKIVFKRKEQLDNVCEEIIKIAKKEGQIPEYNVIVNKYQRKDLSSKISKLGGYKKIIPKVVEIIKENKIEIEYENNSKTEKIELSQLANLKEWKKLCNAIIEITLIEKHIPSSTEIRDKYKRQDLDKAIRSCGGYKIFRKYFDKILEEKGITLEYNPADHQKSIEVLIKEKSEMWVKLTTDIINIVLTEGYIPHTADLRRMGRFDIDYKIQQFGGYNLVLPKIQAIIKEQCIEISSKTSKIENLIQNNQEEWSELFNDLIEIAKGLGNLPNSNDIRYKLKRMDVNEKINKFGGYREVIPKISQILKAQKIELESSDNQENCIIEEDSNIFTDREVFNKKLMDLITNRFNGEFPTYNNLTQEKLYDIIAAIQVYGGHINVALELGFKPSRNPDGFWTKEKIDLELDNFIKELDGKFPEVKDWERYEKGDLYSAIYTHYGGMNAMRIKRGFELDTLSEKSSYYRKRGFATERLIVETLKEYADMCEFSYSDGKQTKIGPDHQIELICGRNKKIGFDVTRSDTKEGVEHHWVAKTYHNFLDTYILIVVSKNFDEKQFKNWNNESPEKVIVIDYRKFETFLNGLMNLNNKFEIPFEKRLKLDALAECTFNTRDQIKKKFKKKKNQKSLKEFLP